MNKKRPVFTCVGCHTKDTQLLSTAVVKSSDLLATGGYDGFINFYKFEKDKKQIIKTNSLPGFDGCINNLAFSDTKGYQTFNTSEILLAASHSQEEKTGRWHVQPKAKTGISIIRKINS